MQTHMEAIFNKIATKVNIYILINYNYSYNSSYNSILFEYILLFFQTIV